MKLQAVGICARDGQQIVDQPTSCRLTSSSMLPMMSRYSARAAVLLQALHSPTLRIIGQRRAQLVGSIGGESPELLEGLFQAGQGCVEDARQLAEFIVRHSSFRQPRVHPLRA